MKKLIVLFCITIVCFANAAVTNTLTERNAVKSNQYQYDDMFVAAPPSLHYRNATANLIDPFSAKTNKYAESKIISVIAEKPVLIKFGDSTITTMATDSANYYIPANSREYFVIDASYPYVRLLNTDSSSSAVYVTEVK